ncbi:MAG: protein kinase [Holosporales bacterium]|jgi:serine/threonine protein kinase|nr:protein kinase [Holosporales bacterium]
MATFFSGTGHACRHLSDVWSAAIAALRPPVAPRRILPKVPIDASRSILHEHITSDQQEITEIPTTNKWISLRFNNLAIVSKQPLGSGTYGIVTEVKGINEQDQTLVVAQKQAKTVQEIVMESKKHAATLCGRVPRGIPIQLGLSKVDRQDVLLFEAIDGETMFDFTHKRHSLFQWDIAIISYGTAIVLQHMHRHGLLHCDIKANNIMLNACRFPFMVDYGLVARIGTHDRRWGLHECVYYPPWACGDGNYEQTPQLDLYCWGLLVLSLLSNCDVFTQPEEGCKMASNVLQDKELRELCRSNVVHPAVKVSYALAVRCVNSRNPHDGSVPSAASIVAQIERCINSPPPPNTSDLVDELKKFRRLDKISFYTYSGLCFNWRELQYRMRAYQRFKFSDAISPKDFRFIATNPNPDDYTVQHNFKEFDAIAFACRYEDLADSLLAIRTHTCMITHKQLQAFCLGQISKLQFARELIGLPLPLSLSSPLSFKALCRQPHIALMCICDYIIANRLGLEALNDANIRTTVLDTLTKWPPITPILPIIVFSTYTRMCILALQDESVDISVQKELRPLFMEVARFLYDHEQGPNHQLIAGGCLSLQIRQYNPSESQLCAYIRTRVSDAMASSEWTLGQMRLFENILCEFVHDGPDFDIAARLSAHRELGGATLSTSMLQRPRYTWMCMHDWLVEHGQIVLLGVNALSPSVDALAPGGDALAPGMDALSPNMNTLSSDMEALMAALALQPK